MLTLQPVKSSNVSAIGYDADAATIVVQFHDGKVYRYPNHGADSWVALQAAESKGRAVAALGCGNWTGMAMGVKTSESRTCQTLTEDASACCKSRWERALDKGKLETIDVWVCPKCGCEYRSQLVGEIRNWVYSGEGAILFKAR